jgi:hypothetical protein
VVLDVAAGTVEAFVEHRGKASCPKSAASPARATTPWAGPGAASASGRDPLASRQTGSLPEAGLHPHDFLKRSLLEHDDAGGWTQARSKARTRAPRPATCVTPLRG